MSVSDCEFAVCDSHCEREEGVVALQLTLGFLNTCSVLELAIKCEVSTYPLISDWLDHFASEVSTYPLISDWLDHFASEVSTYPLISDWLDHFASEVSPRIQFSDDFLCW